MSNYKCLSWFFSFKQPGSQRKELKWMETSFDSGSVDMNEYSHHSPPIPNACLSQFNMAIRQTEQEVRDWGNGGQLHKYHDEFRNPIPYIVRSL